MSPFDAVIVGAGPAGLMAAETIASDGHKVLVVDRMPSAGRKFLMAGRSGLNLTHAEDGAAFLARYGAARPVLEPAIRAFPPNALIRWVEELGEPTFVGSSGRVFPECRKASPILRAWLRRLDGLSVTLLQKTAFVDFSADGIVVDGPEGRREIATRTLVLALGGASWPRLGSDAGWVGALRGYGITIRDFVPSNMGVKVAWTPDFVARFHGEPLKRLAITFAGTTIRAEAVVTRAGLEGGGVYPFAAAIRDVLTRDGSPVLTLDLRPDLSIDELTARLDDGRAKDTVSNRLRKAGGLPPVAVSLLREATGNRIPAANADIARLIKAVAVPISGVSGLERAISSAGGVALDEIDDRFMLVKRPGVFVAGEMLDWDAPTGGYLLQACFSTGRAAGLGAAAMLAAIPR